MFCNINLLAVHASTYSYKCYTGSTPLVGGKHGRNTTYPESPAVIVPGAGLASFIAAVI